MWAGNTDAWDELSWRRHLLGVTHAPPQPSLHLSRAPFLILWLHVPEMLSGLKSHKPASIFQPLRSHSVPRACGVIWLEPRKVIPPQLQFNAVNPLPSAASTLTVCPPQTHTGSITWVFTHSGKREKLKMCLSQLSRQYWWEEGRGLAAQSGAYSGTAVQGKEMWKGKGGRRSTIQSFKLWETTIMVTCLRVLDVHFAKKRNRDFVLFYLNVKSQSDLDMYRRLQAR